jgi:hypothetical protein
MNDNPFKPFPDDGEDIGDALREYREVPDGHQLDRIKRRVLPAVTPRGTLRCLVPRGARTRAALILVIGFALNASGAMATVLTECGVSSSSAHDLNVTQIASTFLRAAESANGPEPAAMVVYAQSCPAGQTHSGGQCVPTSCPPGQTLTGGVCVTPVTSPTVCRASTSGYKVRAGQEDTIVVSVDRPGGPVAGVWVRITLPGGKVVSRTTGTGGKATFRVRPARTGTIFVHGASCKEVIKVKVAAAKSATAVRPPSFTG